MTTQAEPEPLRFPFDAADGFEVSETYRLVRDRRPLSMVRLPYGEPARLVTRYADIRFVLSDPRFSRAAAAGRDVPRQSEAPNTPGLLGTDPPEHTRLRGLIARAFTTRRSERLRPWIRATVADLLDRLVAQGPPADLVEDFAMPISIGVICELLGVPAADRARFREWGDARLSTSVLPAAAIAESTAALRDYMVHLLATRRAAPGDDLISSLVGAGDDPDRLTEPELVELCTTLLFAGYEATSTQIPNFVYFLMGQPDLWRTLRTDPDRIPAAVNELLRYIPLMAGAGTMPRYATADVEVDGTVVRAGEPVLAVLGAGNRDGGQFPSPDVFRLDRGQVAHLAFGHGVHHCVGKRLATIELEESLAGVLTRWPRLCLAGELSWKKQVLRGVRHLPVSWVDGGAG